MPRLSGASATYPPGWLAGASASATVVRVLFKCSCRHCCTLAAAGAAGNPGDYDVDRQRANTFSSFASARRRRRRRRRWPRPAKASVKTKRIALDFLTAFFCCCCLPLLVIADVFCFASLKSLSFFFLAVNK